MNTVTDNQEFETYEEYANSTLDASIKHAASSRKVGKWVMIAAAVMFFGGITGVIVCMPRDEEAWYYGVIGAISFIATILSGVTHMAGIEEFNSTIGWGKELLELDDREEQMKLLLINNVVLFPDTWLRERESHPS